MAEDELDALKTALWEQSLLIKQLTTELEEERKASASGADEALAMIMRLRETKATENMEASHFKMFAQEQLHCAEEAMTILNEKLLEKEMENACLKYRLQEYKQKLLSLGFRDTVEQSSLNSSFRKRKLARNVTLPPLRLEELVSETDEAFNGRDLAANEYDGIKVLGQLDSFVSEYCERKKNGAVRSEEFREKHCITDEQSFSMRANGEGIPSHFRNGGTSESPVCSVNIQEMYDVEDDYTGDSFRLPCSQALKAPVQMTTFPVIREDEISVSSIEEHSLDSSVVPEENEVHTGKHQADLEKLKRWMENLEGDVMTMKQKELERGSEQLKLLSGITEQLESLWLHIGSRKPKEQLHDESSYLMMTLAEAMQSFWI